MVEVEDTILNRDRGIDIVLVGDLSLGLGALDLGDSGGSLSDHFLV